MNIMRSILTIVVILIVGIGTIAAQQPAAIKNDLNPSYQRSMYRVLIDLRHVDNDRVHVHMNLPALRADSAVMVFPATIPGTYEPQSWWRYISEFKAWDSTGAPLPVHRSADHQFVISGAKKLARVDYMVDDSFDDHDTTFPQIFHPAGTSIQADSIFVLNQCGFIGYLDGMSKLIYQVTVIKPPHLYGASALQIKSYSDTLDMYSASSYDALVDNPIIYAVADTASFTVAGTRIMIACANVTDHTIAQQLVEPIKRIATSIASFLGTMPVDRYAFLFYCWDGSTKNVDVRSPAFGALEHNYSSLYFWRAKNAAQGVADVATHEFLHILEPLNLHSEEIANFDFRRPKMSKHLWLYEGVTEYFSDMARIHDSAISEVDLQRMFSRKLFAAAYFPPSLSLTEFSKNVMTDENQQVYPLIYEYGPIVALALDIQLREESKGERGLLDLIRSLSAVYGPDKPFKDDELWKIIEKATSPSIAAFCDRYIEHAERIPVGEVLKKIGWNYTAKKMVSVPGFGIEFRMHGTDPRMLIGPVGDNPLGVEAGDELKKINGRAVNMSDESFWANIMRPSVGDEMTITVVRNGQETDLTGKAVMMSREQRHVIEDDPKATAEQVALRRALLYGS
jgi:predicted metalloprotease with PDZ domain